MYEGYGDYPCNMEPYFNLEPTTIIKDLIVQALKEGVQLRCVLCGGKVTSKNFVIIYALQVIHEDCYVKVMCDNELVIKEGIRRGITTREEISTRLKKYPIHYVLSKLRWKIKKLTGVRLPIPVQERTFKERLKRNSAIAEKNEHKLINWFKTTPLYPDDERYPSNGEQTDSSFSYYT